MEINKEKLREFILFIKDKTNFSSPELIEKDFYLNLLLAKLNLDEFVFKGGTCLAKIYLDYFRLSEDLDLTFINQKLFENKSTQQIKKICKEKIDNFGKQIESIGLNFVLNKSDRNYVELGNNNKLVTYKVWYDSVFTNTPSFVKIQINFLEEIKFEIKSGETIPLIKGNITEDERTYFQDFIIFYEKKKLPVYDIKEIIAEKIRSLLTRRKIKSRDAIDLLFIYNKYNIKPESLIKEAQEKIFYATKNYEKYKKYFILSKENIEQVDFPYSEVKHLVVEDFNEKDFDNFIAELIPLLKIIIKELKL